MDYKKKDCRVYRMGLMESLSVKIMIRIKIDDKKKDC